MEYVEAFLKFVETYGPQWALVFALVLSFVVISWLMIKTNSKSSSQMVSAIGHLSESVDLISQKIESPYMSNESSLTLFREIADNLVYKLLKEVEGVIEKNSLSERKVQIKKNLTAGFQNIVIEKSETLSKFHSKAGDLGQILNDGLDWSPMMKEVFEALFAKHTEQEKVRDIKSILAERLNEIIKTIERRASAN